MKLIYQDRTKRKIENQEKIEFSSFSSYHLIVLTARAKGKQQLSQPATDDEDLTIQIDNKTFPKLNSNRLIDSPAAINGGRMHNLSKTVYFLTYLQGKDHRIILNTDNPPSTATFEKLEIYTFEPKNNLILKPKIQAEDGDRRPWITLALDNVPLTYINITVTYSRRKRDNDDIKIKIDGQTQDNLLRNIKHFLWYFAGSLIPLVSPTKIESQTFITSFLSGLHYIEIDVDRMPTLEKIILNFNKKLPIPKDTPTVDNPKWTGDFYDDTEIMLLARAIYGEAGGESKEAKIAVAWAIRNRVEDSRKRWGGTYHEVILEPFQYEPFKDPESKIFKRITNPLLNNEVEKKAWFDSFESATEVIQGKTSDSTKGANHFYVPLPRESTPSWADEKKFTVQIGVTRFFKL